MSPMRVQANPQISRIFALPSHCSGILVTWMGISMSQSCAGCSHLVLSQTILFCFNTETDTSEQSSWTLHGFKLTLHLLAAGGILNGQTLGYFNSCQKEMLCSTWRWTLEIDNVNFPYSLSVILLLSVDRMPGLNASSKLNPLQISFGQRMVELLTIHKIIRSNTGMEFVVSPYRKHFLVSVAECNECGLWGDKF
jgi:hypothetical protein